MKQFSISSLKSGFAGVLAAGVLLVMSSAASAQTAPTASASSQMAANAGCCGSCTGDVSGPKGGVVDSSSGGGAKPTGSGQTAVSGGTPQ